MERQSSMASSTEEVSGPDLSASSQNQDHFGVFKDFDFLEYESESVEVMFHILHQNLNKKYIMFVYVPGHFVYQIFLFC